METNIATFITSLRSDMLYILIPWPFFVGLKEHSWFDEECVYYGTWDDESIIKAYFVPIQRLHELHEQGDPELFLFTATMHNRQ